MKNPFIRESGTGKHNNPNVDFRVSPDNFDKSKYSSLDWYSLPLVKGTILKLRTSEMSRSRSTYRILRDIIDSADRDVNIEYSTYYLLTPCDIYGRIYNPDRVRKANERWIHTELAHGSAELIFTPTGWPFRAPDKDSDYGRRKPA